MKLMTISTAALSAGLRSGLSRIRPLRLTAIALAAVAISAAAALVERRSWPHGAATHVLADVVFGLVVPVFAFYLCVLAFDGTRLDTAGAASARFGASGRSVALGLLVAGLVPVVLVSAAAASSAVLLAHDRTAPPSLIDALTVVWIAALTSSAYVGVFGLGSTFGVRGSGRLVFLAIDFLLGESMGAASLVFPRWHALNLVGSPVDPALSPTASVCCLSFIALAAAGSALARCRP